MLWFDIDVLRIYKSGPISTHESDVKLVKIENFFIFFFRQPADRSVFKIACARARDYTRTHNILV